MEDSRFYKADLDLQLQLIADVLIVQPVSKRRFGIDNLFDLFRQSLALVVDDSTVNLFIGSVFKIILVPQGKENIVERLFFRPIFRKLSRLSFIWRRTSSAWS